MRALDINKEFAVKRCQDNKSVLEDKPSQCWPNDLWHTALGKKIVTQELVDPVTKDNYEEKFKLFCSRNLNLDAFFNYACDARENDDFFKQLRKTINEVTDGKLEKLAIDLNCCSALTMQLALAAKKADGDIKARRAEHTRIDAELKRNAERRLALKSIIGDHS